MPDIIDIISQLLNLTWRQFLSLMGSFAMLVVGAAVAAFWPGESDKTVVLNTFIWIAMATACGIYLYVRFGRKPDDSSPR